MGGGPGDEDVATLMGRLVDMWLDHSAEAYRYGLTEWSQEFLGYINLHIPKEYVTAQQAERQERMMRVVEKG